MKVARAYDLGLGTSTVRPSRIRPARPRTLRREPAYDPAVFEQEPVHAWVDTMDAEPDRLVLAGEIGTRVDQTLLRLTSLERAAFMLRHIEGMSINEIGSALGLNTSATKHSIFRAVRKMRAALAPFKEGVGCWRSR